MHTFSDPSRRGFLAGTAATLAWGGLQAASAARRGNLILLWLTGGPSHLDTFDPKPGAPSNIRGPFRPIATSVPGLHLSETLPRLAQQAHRFALVRSVYHDVAPVHETGLQLLQTGRLSTEGAEAPHIGAELSFHHDARWAILPEALGHTGLSVSHGQGPGTLGDAHAATVPTRLDLGTENPTRYGSTTFGRACLAARRLVEQGTRVVHVNMFSTVFNEKTWDCHADGGSLATTLEDYRRTVCPAFDTACAALLDDLHDRGLLESTMVVALGEFGRTPHLNARGGRDHWAGVWSILLAGGGIRGGQVLGASDAQGGEPASRPVHACEIADTLRLAVGLPAPRAVRELFGSH
jgi:uncharacterized protein (DUF1501 family)